MRQVLFKRLLAIFLLSVGLLSVGLLSAAPALAGETGFYMRAGTGSFVAPTANQTAVYDTVAKQWKVWNGTIWQVLSTGISNVTATVSPTVSNDSTQGYSAGSVWVDTTHQTSFLCVNASAGAAVWLAIAPNPALFTTADNFSDYLVSGLVGSVPSSTLTMTTPAGVIYSGGLRVSQAATTYTYPINSDTYDYFQTNSTFNHVAVANNAAAPTGQAGQLIQKVVTNGTVITAVTSMAQTAPLFNVANATTAAQALNRATGDARYAPISPTGVSQSQNQAFMSPSAGSGVPAFRSILNLDLPVISTANGGTNINAYATGDILYASAPNVLSRLAATTNTYVLTLAGGVPVWAAPTASGVTNFTAGNLSPIFTSSVATPSSTPALTFTLTNASPGAALHGPINNASGAAASAAAPTYRTLDPIDVPVFRQDLRATLTTGVPVTSADVTGASAATVYVTPYKGNHVTIYNTTQSKWIDQVFAEASVAVPATTVTPFNVFITSAGNTTITVSTVNWTNDTTPGSAALTLLNGRYVLSTNNALLYVATGRTTTVSGQTEDSEARRLVWNYFNRVARTLKAVDSTATWTYAVNTVRSANASTVPGTGRTDFVIGVAECEVTAAYASTGTSGVASTASVGIAFDSTTAYDRFASFSTLSGGSLGSGSIQKIPAVGYHFIQNLESAPSAATITFNGANQSYQFGTISP